METEKQALIRTIEAAIEEARDMPDKQRSREKSLAFTRLQEALAWANAMPA